MVVFDNTMLALLWLSDPGVPKDPDTGRELTAYKDRVDYLIKTLVKSKTTILIPTPALSELLTVVNHDMTPVLQQIKSSKNFKVVDFDTRAAIEAAAMSKEALQSGDKKSGSKKPWQHVKIDRQIIAIARVNGAEKIYSDDGGVSKFCVNSDLAVIPSHKLPLPPVDPQSSLNV